MSAMRAEVFEAFRATDVSEDEALRAAAALARAPMSEVGQAEIGGELAVLRWRTGFVSAFPVAVALELFVH